MKTLFLDYDGVLFDTLKEAYLICRSVFYGDSITVEINTAKYETFYKYKYLVYNVWQYYYLMVAIDDGGDIEKTYKSLLNNRQKIEEEVFTRMFEERRKKTLKENKELIDKLEQPFPFYEKIKEISELGTIDVVIVSRKNNFAIKTKISDKRIKIFGKEELENVINKSEFIEKYMKDNNVEKGIFVDDNFHNLIPCSNIANLKCMLAGWGNIAPTETGCTLEEIMKEIEML